MPYAISYDVPLLSHEQRFYLAVLAKTVEAELDFLLDVIDQRAQGRKTVTDKVLDHIKSASSVIAPGINIGSSITYLEEIAASLSGVFDKVNTVLTDISDGASFINAIIPEEKAPDTLLHSLYAISNKLQLELLLTQVGREAACRWEYFINNKLNDLEAVHTFATVGAARIIDYLSINNLPVTLENLLAGLMKGRSGVKGKYDFFNKSVKGVKGTKRLTAEGAYGRSGLLGPDGQFYIHADHAAEEKTLLHQRPEKEDHYGYVKFIDEDRTKNGPNSKRPKYGYCYSPIKDINLLKFISHIPHLDYKIWLEQKTYSRFIDSATIMDYLNAMPDDLTQPRLSLNQWLGKNTAPSRHSVLAVFRGKLKRLPLEKGDFTGVDFSDCDIENCQLGNFQKAYLAFSRWKSVTVSKKVLEGAVLDGIRFEECTLKGAHLLQTSLRFGDIKKSDLSQIVTVGLRLEGTKLDAYSMNMLGQDSREEILKNLEEKQREHNKLIEESNKIILDKILDQDQKIKALNQTTLIHDKKLIAYDQRISMLESLDNQEKPIAGNIINSISATWSKQVKNLFDVFNLYIPLHVGQYEVMSPLLPEKNDNNHSESKEENSSVSSASGDDLLELDKVVQDFLTSNKLCLLLLGTSGNGKTLGLLKLAEQLLKNLNSNNSSSSVPNTTQAFIPIFIPLAYQEHSNNKLVENFLRNECRLNDFQIDWLKTQPVLLILDGYDEIPPDAKGTNLYRSNQLYGWNNIKVIISCRTEALSNYTDLQIVNIFTPYKNLNEKCFDDKLARWYVQSFNEKQINNYIIQSVQLNPLFCNSQKESMERVSELSNAVNQIPSLKKLIVVPFLLKIALDVLPEVLAKHQRKKKAEQLYLTRLELYQIFTQQWFGRRKQKLLASNIIDDTWDIEKDFIEYTKRLACRLWQQGEMIIVYDPADPILKRQSTTKNFFSPSIRASERNEKFSSPTAEWGDFFAEKGFFMDDEKKPLSIIREGCPLFFLGKNRWAFLHKSLLEYFAAERLFKSTQVKASIILGIEFNDKLITDDPSIIQFAVDNIQQDSNFKSILRDIIEESKHEPGVTIAAANAITMLNAARIPFSGENFQRIRVKGANLSGAILDGTDLRESDLREVNFSHAWLKNANLTGACMDKVYLGEMPYLEMIDQPYTCGYSSDDKMLAVAAGKYINLFDADNDKLISQLKHNDIVQTFAFDATGQYIISGDINKTLYMWDCTSKKTISHFNSLETIRKVAISTDKKYIASAYLRTIHLYEVATGKLIRDLKKHTDIMSGLLFILYQDKQILVSSAEDRIICFWDINDSKVDTIDSSGQSYCLNVSKDHKYIATGNWDSTISVWEISTKRLVNTFPTRRDVVNSIDFYLRNDTYILVSGTREGNLDFWQIPSGKLLYTLSGATSHIIKLAINNVGQIIFTRLNDNKVYRLEIASIIGGLVKPYYSGHEIDWSKSGCVVKSSYDHQYIISAARDGRICIYEPVTGKLLNKFEVLEEEFTIVTSSQDSQYIAAVGNASREQIIYIFNVKSQSYLYNFKYDKDHINYLIFTQDNNHLIIVGTHGITFFEIATQKLSYMLNSYQRSRLGGLGMYIKGYYALHPSGSYVVFGSEYQLIAKNILWDKEKCVDKKDVSIYSLDNHPTADLLKFSNVAQRKTCKSIIFSSDGRYMAATLETDLYIWDLIAKKLLYTLKENGSEELTFSWDSQYLAVWRTGKIFHVVSGKKVLEIPKEWSSYRSFSWGKLADSNIIITGDATANIFCWRFIMKNSQQAQLQLYWSSKCATPHLISQNSKISQTTGLDGNKCILFKQGGAFGNPSTKSTDEVLKLRNSLRIVDRQMKLNSVFSEDCLLMADSQWVVTIARKRQGDAENHAFLILESIECEEEKISQTNCYYHRIRRADLFLEMRLRDDKPNCSSRSQNKALIEIRDKTLNDIEMLAPTCFYRSWEISPEQGRNLLKNIEEEQRREIRFSTWQVGRAVNRSSHNCLTWCEAQLEKIGIDLSVQKSWIDWLVVHPSRHLPASLVNLKKQTENLNVDEAKEDQCNTRECSTQKNCYII